MKARTLVSIMSLAVAMVACNNQQPDLGRAAAPAETATPVETAAPADAAPADASDRTAGTSGQPPQERAALPDTASPLPLVGLAGPLSLGIAIGLRVGRRQ